MCDEKECKWHMEHSRKYVGVYTTQGRDVSQIDKGKKEWKL